MWEFIFLMVILKIPIVYLCLVVYWAVRADGRPPEPAPLLVPAEVPQLGPRWSPRRPRGVTPRPHGRPTRSPRPRAPIRVGAGGRR